MKDEYTSKLTVDGKTYNYIDVPKLAGDADYARLPFSIRVLLESAVRNCDGFQVKASDVEAIKAWEKTSQTPTEVKFKPARVVLQDFTGVPAIVDFAAMRDAVQKLGGSAEKINPICPVDLVVDHSVQVDFTRTPDAAQKNQEREFERNSERFLFLKWGARAFENMMIIPPGSGIVHQVNLEYLARVVFDMHGWLYPDSLVGTDSHTTMINGLGVLGWGVGGIEAEAVMLGQAISMVLPEVVGYKITGRIHSLATSTDVVLTITKHLRKVGVVGKFVEFFGPGVSFLSIADRATISNMCPEYGATAGFFPVDQKSIEYLTKTGRDSAKVQVIEEYLRKVKMFRDYSNEKEDPVFSQVVELDLATIVPSLSGPKRPQDRVSVTDMQKDFKECLTNKVGFKGFGLEPEKLHGGAVFRYENEEYKLNHGSVVIAAITSCTNTSNPTVMLGSGILARNAVQRGLKVAPYIKTSLSPGSGVVTYYLKDSGVLPYLEKLGFDIVGYGCMTCIGNSGPIPEPVEAAITDNGLVCCGVLSGNRNFEGRIHPNTRANYLASPMLVVAYALAGTVDIDFETQPIGHGPKGDAVYLRDIWPTRTQIQEVEKQFVLPKMFTEVYEKITEGTDQWRSLDAPASILYPWKEESTYIRSPPFFKTMTIDPPKFSAIRDANALLFVGDSVTTDHISPAGSISRTCPAARYLAKHGLKPKDFNSYGSRRGNDEIMARGTFANIRLKNKLIGKEAPKTVHVPSGEIVCCSASFETSKRFFIEKVFLSQMDVFDAAMRYKEESRQLIIVAGRDYGTGSSRDWAAKGPWILVSMGTLLE